MSGEILTFRLGGLGDLLVALPGLNLIREAYSGRKITLICREAYGLLLREAGIVDGVVSADAALISGLYRESCAGEAALRAWLGRFSSVWCWMSGRESGPELARSLIRLGTRNVHCIGPPPRPLSRPFYQYFFSETAAALNRPGLGAAKPEAFCRLALSGERGAHRPSTRARPAIIHPGSGGREKCWPLERFLEVVLRLAARGMGGFLVTGEAEERLEPALEQFHFPDGWTWMRRPPLVRLAGLLAGCRFYLGNDSGVSHLAAACGALVVALFRRENEILWRPCGRVGVVSAVNVEEIGLEDAWPKILSVADAHD